jgi:hypothetical protein
MWLKPAIRAVTPEPIYAALSRWRRGRTAPHGPAPQSSIDLPARTPG